MIHYICFVDLTRIFDLMRALTGARSHPIENGRSNMVKISLENNMPI